MKFELHLELFKSQFELKFGGADGVRTHDPLNAIQVLSQLSYSPTRETKILQKKHKTIKPGI